MKLLKLISFFVIFATSVIKADDWQRVLNLKGFWKFNIGDNSEWKNQYFKDDDWDDIKVPAFWEDEGFNGYDGYAWYRKNFTISEKYTKQTLFLMLGYIDDVDEVYINGKLVGSSGKFPPEYQTSYYSFRNYPIPRGWLKAGNNTIAVRVYDAELGGGINNGDVGIFVTNSIPIQIGLEGYWKFSTGDNQKWKDFNFDDSKWNSILVPGFWESQGYNDYDGFAWYRKKFIVSKDLINQKLVLVLGKIDDGDQVFINGNLVGSMGNFSSNPPNTNDCYDKLRNYFLPQNLLKNGENVIAVRVYDQYKDGGIYLGPIGITTQKEYTKFWRKNDKKSFWERLFN